MGCSSFERVFMKKVLMLVISIFSGFALAEDRVLIGSEPGSYLFFTAEGFPPVRVHVTTNDVGEVVSEPMFKAYRPDIIELETKFVNKYYK